MILSDNDIKGAISSGKIIIDPSPLEDQFQPSSLDLRVGRQFFEWDENLTQRLGIEVVIDFEKYTHRDLRRYMREVTPRPDGSIEIEPKKFYLVQTLERIDLPLSSGIAGRVEGRSGLARLGVSIHQTAPIIHCGFNGTLTLEISNLGPFPIRVMPERSCLCQVVFEAVSSVPGRDLSSRFQGQQTPTGK